MYWRNHDLKQRDDWERARMIAFYAAAPHTKKIKKPTDIVKFDWEKKERPRVKSKEEFYRLKEKLLDGK